MANRSTQSDTSRDSRLDAENHEEIVYCHQCEHEWHQNNYGLECPYCGGAVTEIVVPGPDDPRRGTNRGSQSLPIRGREPWFDDALSPGDTDTEEFATDGSNSFLFSRTFRNSNSRNMADAQNGRNGVSNNETGHVMSDFMNMLNNLLGPQLHHSAPGRSGPETLFHEPSIQTSSFQLGGNEPRGSVLRSRIIFTNGPISEGDSLRPRNTDEPQSGVAPQVDDMPSVGGSGSSNGSVPQPRPLDIQSLFSALLSPRNARFGDAVYSEEALDHILSTLMEQSPHSNAPGPASSEAIAALPRKKLNAKLLGPDGKGECSVCMDEVKIGDEVMVLPCKHWFDEACVTSWLKEHNTCPICRKAINDESRSSNSSSSERTQNTSSNNRNSNRAQRISSTNSRFSREPRTRNEERLNFLRDSAAVNLSESTLQYSRSPAQERDEVTLPGSFPRDSVEHSENRRSERPRNSRTNSAPGGNGSTGRSSTLSRIRGLHDRLSNNRRNE